MREQWSHRSVDPATSVLLYGQRPAGRVSWACRLTHPLRTMDRIVRNLNLGVSCPPRTWTWRPFSSGPHHVELLHNGRSCADVRWADDLRNPERWNSRVVDGMNLPMPADWPYPEPLPPRPAEFVRGGFDVNARSVA